MPGYFKEKPFQIAGDKNIHGRAAGLFELPVTVIDAGTEKIRKDLVFVGGADQFIDRQAHPLRIPGGQDIAKIAGWYRKIDLLSGGDLLLFEEIEISPEIIDNLRQEAAPIDGVGR